MKGRKKLAFQTAYKKKVSTGQDAKANADSLQRRPQRSATNSLARTVGQTETDVKFIAYINKLLQIA